MPCFGLQCMIVRFLGPEVKKLEYSLKLEIKCNDWLLADSSQSLRFILSLEMNSSFITRGIVILTYLFTLTCIIEIIKIFMSKTQPRALIFGMLYHLVNRILICSNSGFEKAEVVFLWFTLFSKTALRLGTHVPRCFWKDNTLMRVQNVSQSTLPHHLCNKLPGERDLFSIFCHETTKVLTFWGISLTFTKMIYLSQVTANRNLICLIIF